MLRHGTHEREGSDEWPAEGRAKSETAARKGVCACARVGSGKKEREGKKDENEIQVRWGWERGTVTQTIWLIDSNIRLWSAISWLYVTSKR
jgi:hypothetical protein